MELLLEEAKQKKADVGGLSKRCEEQEKRIEQLEQESLEQHQMLDDAEARVVKLKAGLVESEALGNDLQTKLDNLEGVCDKVKTLEAVNVGLRGELEARSTPSPEPDVKELKDEVVALRQRVLHMDQLENEVAELQQELSEVGELKSKLVDKLMESEKVYDEEVEKLRSLVIQRDELIESMKRDLDRVEADLQSTKAVLEESSADNERIVTEKSRRVDDLSEALVDYDATQKMLAEKESSLAEKEDQVERLREENEELGRQVEKLNARIEIVESENGRLKMYVEDQIETDEECRELQAQKIARLEGFVAEYETEVKELSESNAKLQTQIFSLEDANGKLQSECLLNESLKEQVLQLQKDLKNDTSLRQELGRSIELLKLNLGDEISSLEERLRDERERHAATKEAALRLEQETVGLKREMNGYLIKQGEASEEIRNLEAALRKKETATTQFKDCSAQRAEGDGGLRIKELEHVLEEKRRSVCSLEDHISTLKFHLEQKSNELEDARRLLALNSEKSEQIMEQMRRTQESLRVELAQQVQSAELLAEERNSYRAQVLEMNSALKNSLEHIKELRSKASPDSAAAAEDPFAEFTQRKPLQTANASSSSGRNISSLQGRHSTLFLSIQFSGRGQFFLLTLK